MKRLMLRRLLGLAVLLSVAAAAPSAAHDELRYSAAACVPASGSQWEGNGAKGFKFEHVTGGWFNYDVGDSQYLICPVPFFKDFFNLEKVVARVHIYDGHLNAYAAAWLCGQPASGTPVCVSKDNFPATTGHTTIELTLTPALLTDYVWLRVRIPANAEDGSPWTPSGTSGMIGYWIFRQ